MTFACAVLVLGAVLPVAGIVAVVDFHVLS